MFDLEVFPARDGDCLMLTWGSAGAPKRMLIDGGRESCWTSLKGAIAALPEGERHFELLVVTHIDADHIAGVLKMLADPKRGFTFKEVWFNAYRHLPQPDLEELDVEQLGVGQGEQLSALLAAHEVRWNRRLGGAAVVVEDPAHPPRFDIEGLELTLLSPTRPKLAELEAVWKAWVRAEGLQPGGTPRPEGVEEGLALDGFEVLGGQREYTPPTRPDVDALAAGRETFDPEAANGSSIAFIARYGDQRLLLSGDAHSDVLVTALRALPAAERRFDLVKLSHHGSRRNLGRTLAATWEADRFLVTTNGSIHHHPDAEAIAVLLKAAPGSKTIYFNYRHPEAVIWDDAGLMETHDYRAVYCADDALGRLSLSVSATP